MISVVLFLYCTALARHALCVYCAMLWLFDRFLPHCVRRRHTSTEATCRCDITGVTLAPNKQLCSADMEMFKRCFHC